VSSDPYDVIIIGAGPAGLTAAIYAARMKLKALVLESSLPGGRAVYAPTVENFPGFPEGIIGADLVDKMVKQAKRFGAETRFSQEVLDIAAENKTKTVVTRSGKFEGLAVIIATGTQQKKLSVPGESEHVGRGVSYCAVCDGPLFRNKAVAVVGSNDYALEDAVYLSTLSKRVILLSDKEEMEAAKMLVEKAKEKTNVDMVNARVKEIIGDGVVTAVKIVDREGKEDTIKVDGVFILVGSLPMTNIVRKAGVIVDERGCIKVDRRQATNVEGIFAAGDCTCGGMQIITAAGEGATAAVQAYRQVRSRRN
jgi:thioredoxin reductase (NADPH)